MSRSKRKPMLTDGYGTKHKHVTKRRANRAVRKAKEVSDGKAYRKEYNSWDIVDWKFWDPKNKKASRK